MNSMARSYPSPLAKTSVRMLTIELFSTDHCSLCEQALDMLLGMPEIAGQELRVVDIALQEELLARYGERIPVLRVLDDELAAPFTRSDVLRWLDRLARREQAEQGSG